MYLRRLITVPAVILITPLLWLTAPLTLLLALVKDLATEPRRLPTVRVLLLIILCSGVEFGGVVLATLTWVASGFGLAKQRSAAMSDWAVRWWTTGLLGAARVAVGLRMQVDGFGAALRQGPVIAIGRHTSIADAPVPMWFLGTVAKRDIRYILTKGLQWGPCFDLVGNRAMAHFVDRSGSRSADEIDAIEALGAAETETSFVGLFPEGRFRLADRFDRAVEKIRESDPRRADRMSTLLHLMPPLPGGFLGLMRGSQHSDVIVIGHVGFENYASNSYIYANVPFAKPCQIKMWRFARADLPTEDAGRLAWLDDVWMALDEWIELTMNPETP